MFVAPVSEVLVATGMARMKQTASLIEGLLYLTFVFCFSFSAMVNIMRVTRSADREAEFSNGLRGYIDKWLSFDPLGEVFHCYDCIFQIALGRWKWSD